MTRGRVCALVGAGIWAVSMAVFAQTGGGSNLTKVVIQNYPGPINLLTQVAVEKGFCRDHGIECDLKLIPAAPLGIQTLLSKGIDIALPPPEVAIQGALKGADIRVIGTAFRSSVFFLAVGNHIELPAGGDYKAVLNALKGKKIGVTSRGAGPEFQYKTMLKAVGLGDSDVTFVAVGSPNTAYPALANKQVDAVMGFIPLDGFCDVLKTCRIAVAPFNGEGPAEITRLNGAGGIYVVRRDYDPRLVEAFQGAVRDSTRFIQDPANFEQVYEIARKNFRIEHPQGDAILRSTVKRFLTSWQSELNPQAVQAVQAAADYLHSTGQVPETFNTARFR
ncbi:ABC transporter substrate-binding protein [Aromatoleum toluolicum]|uniref:ABC transporter substrate-binding protein n=1 Tax=Aromatoleum toluolicum TaxID=90060 RepID=A0ABX1NJP3_9RHOO|nr:ABC transporter substrate-binding protein [Aromatoleum toluolicum]NMF99542.1 ABC transporter substrate-binding protein [Aromatoleum toluolicum]